MRVEAPPVSATYVSVRKELFMQKKEKKIKPILQITNDFSFLVWIARPCKKKKKDSTTFFV